MKKAIFIVVVFLTTLGYSQNKRMEQRSVVEDGLVKSWVIEKEYDHEGNLINYDSTYSEKPLGENGTSFYWGSGDGMQFDFKQGDFGEMGAYLDSLRSNSFNSLHYNFEEMLERYHQQLQHNFDFVPTDSTEFEDVFIFPENTTSKKRI